MLRRIAAIGTVLVFAGACASPPPETPKLDDYVRMLEPTHYWESVWASGANDAWIVGHRGELRHWDGVTLSTVLSGTTQDLLGVWGTASSDVWAIGTEGTLLHFDGFVWHLVESGTRQSLRSIWGSSPEDVWAVGNHGAVVHWNGTRWQAITSGTDQNLRGVWTAAPGDAWAVGDSGTVLHWDGIAWSAVPLETHQDLTSIWGASADDFWIGGISNVLVHRTGGAWQTIAGDSYDYRRVVRFGGTSAEDVWVIDPGGPGVSRWDGAQWTSSGTAGEYAGFWAVSPTEQWFCGGGNVIVHLDGALSELLSIPEVQFTINVDPNVAVGVSSGFPFYEMNWNGKAWMPTLSALPVAPGPGPFQFLTRSDGWRVTHKSLPDQEIEQLEHWDGTTWDVRATLSVVDPVPLFSSLWTSGDGDVWTAGNGHLAHWDGRIWDYMDSPAPADVVRGLSPDDVWAFGIKRDPNYDSAKNKNSVLHWDGKKWKAVLDETGGAIADLWPRQANDAHLIWDDGRVQRWDGKSWKDAWVSGSAWTAALVVISPDDAWIANGHLLHWDGKRWNEDLTQPLQNITLLWQDRTGSLWAAGAGATTLHRVHDRWVLESGIRPAFRALDVIQGEPWVGTSSWWSGGRVLRVAANREITPMAISESWVYGISGDSPDTVRVASTWDPVRNSACCRGIPDAYALARISGEEWSLNWSQVQHDTPDGTDSATLAAEFELQAIGGTASNVWAVGQHGLVFHNDGNGWQQLDAHTHGSLNGVWSSGPHDTWIVGVAGTVLHADGETLTSVDAGTTADLNAVSGTGPDDVWIVGNSGTVVHWDGRTWKRQTTDVVEPLLAVQAVSPHEVWVAGGDATLLKLTP